MPDIKVFPATNMQAYRNFKCDWCGEPILVLSKYVYTRGVFDGKLEVMYFHQDCFDAGAAMDQEELAQINEFFVRGTTIVKPKETK